MNYFQPHDMIRAEIDAAWASASSTAKRQALVSSRRSFDRNDLLESTRYRYFQTVAQRPAADRRPLQKAWVLRYARGKAMRHGLRR